MYGKAKTYSEANRCYQADAGSQGSQPEKGSKDPNKERAEARQRLSDAQSKASEEQAKKDKETAEELTLRAGLKKPKEAKLEPIRKPKPVED